MLGENKESPFLISSKGTVDKGPEKYPWKIWEEKNHKQSPCCLSGGGEKYEEAECENTELKKKISRVKIEIEK